MDGKHAIPQMQPIREEKQAPRDVVTITCSIFLTCNTIFALIRAIHHKDYDSIYYILFVYFSVMLLFGCLKTLQRIPRHEESVREIVKVAILVISLSLCLTTALKFAPVLGTAGLSIILGMNLAACLCYMFCNELAEDKKQVAGDMKTNSLETSSSPLNKV